jgi:tetratricopeptide (TPR) repeat protein
MARRRFIPIGFLDGRVYNRTSFEGRTNLAMKGLFSAWREWRERRDILRDLRREQADNSEVNRFRVRDGLEEALATADLNDHLKATQIWIDLLNRYPTETRASRLALQVLIKLRRFDEAEALMRAGEKKHPRDYYFPMGLGEIAQAKGDHDEAIQRHAGLRKRFPGVVQGYTRGALSLAAKNRLDEAEALAEEAMQRFPDDIGGFLEYARLAGRREDWPEALRRWQIVQGEFSTKSFGYMGRAQAMIRLGRYDEADALLADTRIRFPTESGPFAEAARCATARGDVPEATERWKRRYQRFPLEVHGYWDAAWELEKLGAVAEAEAALRTAVDRFPNEERPVVELANLLQRHQRP